MSMMIMPLSAKRLFLQLFIASSGQEDFYQPTVKKLPISLHGLGKNLALTASPTTMDTDSQVS